MKDELEKEELEIERLGMPEVVDLGFGGHKYKANLEMILYIRALWLEGKVRKNGRKIRQALEGCLPTPKQIGELIKWMEAHPHE